MVDIYQRLLNHGKFKGKFTYIKTFRWVYTSGYVIPDSDIQIIMHWGHMMFLNNDSLTGEKIWYYIPIISKSIVRISSYTKLVAKL